jgi:hypothetical protein
MPNILLINMVLKHSVTAGFSSRFDRSGFAIAQAVTAASVYEQRWPLPAAWLGSVLQPAGVVVPVGVFTRPTQPPGAAVALAGACPSH